MALNLAIQGALGPGDRVLTTGLEHNSMLRPLYQMQKQGMALDILPLNPQGTYTMEDLRAALQPNTTALCINAMSNVTGFAAPIADIAAFCLEQDLLLILDLSQYAGTRALPQVAAWPRCLMAFTGHKSLYGPQGVGGLVKKGEISPPVMIMARRKLSSAMGPRMNPRTMGAAGKSFLRMKYPSMPKRNMR